MFSQFICWFFFFVLSSVVPEAANAQDLRQAVFIKENSRYLNVPRVGTYTVYDVFDCTFKCLSKPWCLSLNLAAYKRADGKLWCELLSSEKYSNPKEYKANESSHHFSVKTPCMFLPCQNGGTCVANYKYHSFHCHCFEGVLGEYCEIALKSSCKDLYDHNVNKLNMSQVVTLIFDSKPTSVLCHVGDFGCGGGGWTPVMKIDGNKQTFHYSSTLWSNKKTFKVVGGETGFDSQEAKLPSYWNTSFSKICLGMKISQQINFAVIAKQANSLHSLIADGQYRATSLGRDTWKSLIGSQASLQTYCNKEGFNAVSDGSGYSKARIGFLGNEYNHCYKCDSRIGFGTSGKPNDNNTCGNEAHGPYSLNNTGAHIKGMGYIFVQ